MDFVALVVLLVVAALSIRAWSQRPAAQFVEDFATIWGASPWGKQLLVDFSGLAVVLVLWMTTHAYETGNWLIYGICVAAMAAAWALLSKRYALYVCSNRPMTLSSVPNDQRANPIISCNSPLSS